MGSPAAAGRGGMLGRAETGALLREEAFGETGSYGTSEPWGSKEHKVSPIQIDR